VQMTTNQEKAARKYRTPDVRGDGSVARVSRCLPTVIVALFPTLADALRAAGSGKKCSEWGCRGEHTTEYLDDDSVRDVFPWQD